MITIQGRLLEMLEAVALALGDDLRRKVVFVGGCSTAVLLTDEIALTEVRATDDVDLIVGSRGFAQWARLQEQLHERGFTVSSEDEVICRVRLGSLKVDFMPDDERILGFSNRWYRQGIETAVKYALPSGLEIRHLSTPIFIATKFEAYLGRGKDDPLSSHDLEDILIVIDGREELAEEVRAADGEIRTFIAEQLKALRAHRDFEHFLHGNVNGPQGRADLVLGRIDAIVDAASRA